MNTDQVGIVYFFDKISTEIIFSRENLGNKLFV